MGILEESLPTIVAEEIQRALAPFAAGLKRFRRLVEAAEAAGLVESPISLPEIESPEPEQKQEKQAKTPAKPRKKRVARPAPTAPVVKPTKSAKPAKTVQASGFAVGDEVTFKRGRGTYAGTIVGTDEATGALRVKRAVDGVEVVRSADLLSKATSKPGRKKTAAPAKHAAKKQAEAAPKAKPAAPSKPGPKAKKAAPEKQPKKNEGAKQPRKRAAQAAAAPEETEPTGDEAAETAEPITVSEGQHVLFEHNGGAHKGKVKTVHYATGLLDIVRSDGSEISKKASQVQPTEE